MTSKEYAQDVRKINQKVQVATTTLAQVPLGLAHGQQVASESYPNGLPKPYSDDPKQWILHGHLQPATDPLQVAVARLLGYRWPAEQPFPSPYPSPSPSRRVAKAWNSPTRLEPGSPVAKTGQTGG